MKLSIQCPHCKHRTFKNFGVIVRIGANYTMEGDYLTFHILGNYSFLKMKKSGNVLGFYCQYCKHAYPKRMTSEIYKYIKYRKLLCNLKS